MEIEESVPNTFLIPYKNGSNANLCYFKNNILKDITYNSELHRQQLFGNGVSRNI